MKGIRQWLGKAVDCLLHKRAGQAQARSRGQHGELWAARYLAQQGLRVLVQNYRCKGGEIDLIADDAGCIVFVEVRLRSGDTYGGAAASITPRKQARIELAARHWLNGPGLRYRQHPCRFDAVLLAGLDAAQCTWVRAAFAGAPR